jgi:hypothetical protein
MSTPKLSRKELQQKFNERLNKINEKRFQPSPHKVNKIKKDIAKEKKLNDNDPRVTKLMNDYFIDALKTYPLIEIPDPHTVLENKEKYELNYYNFCIKILKKNNNNSELLDNSYCRYMREVLGLNN